MRNATWILVGMLLIIGTSAWAEDGPEMEIRALIGLVDHKDDIALFAAREIKPEVG